MKQLTILLLLILSACANGNKQINNLSENTTDSIELSSSENDTLTNCTKDIPSEIRLKEGVNYISNSGFRDRTDIKSVVLPSSNVLGLDEAFLGCKSIEKIYFHSNRPPLYIDSAFEDYV